MPSKLKAVKKKLESRKPTSKNRRIILETLENSISLQGITHHHNLYGDRHWQFGSVSVIQLFYNEHHHHDHYGHDQVTDVGGGYLDKDFLQSLQKNQIQSQHASCY